MTGTKRDRRMERLSLMRGFLRGSIFLFLCGMICAGIVSLLDMIGPRIISFAVDSVIGTREPALPRAAAALLDAAGGVARLREKPYLIAAALSAVALAAALFRFLFRWLNALAAEKMVKNMRDSLYRKIEHLPYAWHGQNSTGDIIQRCTSDVETIKVFVSEQLTSLIRVVVLIALAMFFMARINVAMTLIASLYIPVVVGYSLFFFVRIGSAFEKADTEEGRLSAIAQENLTGVRVVRAFGKEEFERERFEKQNYYYTGFWVRLIQILTLNWVSGDLVTGLQYLLVTILGIVYCVGGKITAGQFIAFVSYNAMLTWPVRSLGRVIAEMSKAGISLDRLLYIMRESDEPEVSAQPQALTGQARAAETAETGEIRFEHVSFTYPGAPGKALDDVSFTIPAGSTLGILGSTGSGKSTLMYLLLRLYELGEGEGRITVGGRDIREIPIHELRERIGMAAQEPFLFSRTLKENICIAADPDAEALLARAVYTADLEETIRKFPSGYDTFVGERGVTLSGGQKQRTDIARLLMRGCPVMVFDDSLSAVDAQTDEQIRGRLREQTAGDTVILISHRVMTLMHADRILVLEQGRIAEQGTHEELVGRDGIYRQIYDVQAS